jgi:hypothetical protein
MVRRALRNKDSRRIGEAESTCGGFSDNLRVTISARALGRARQGNLGVWDVVG